VAQTASPSAPALLTATVVDGVVVLAWMDDNPAETAVVVQRSTDGTVFADYATLDAHAMGYTDAAVAAGGSYSYRVYSVMGTVASPPSGTASVTLAPAAPGNLSAAAEGTAVTLTWGDVAGETGYTLERSEDGTAFTPLATLGADVLGYTDSGLTAATTYTYRLTASNGGGGASATVVVVTPQAPKLVLPGDANGDGTVNSFDLNLLAGNWLATPATPAMGDFNGDGTVDSFDLNILAAHWMESSPSTAAPVASAPVGSVGKVIYATEATASPAVTATASADATATAAVTTSSPVASPVPTEPTTPTTSANFIPTPVTVPDAIRTPVEPAEPVRPQKWHSHSPVARAGRLKHFGRR
jgi:hypothetical protein